MSSLCVGLAGQYISASRVMNSSFVYLCAAPHGYWPRLPLEEKPVERQHLANALTFSFVSLFHSLSWPCNFLSPLAFSSFLDAPSLSYLRRNHELAPLSASGFWPAGSYPFAPQVPDTHRTTSAKPSLAATLPFALPFAPFSLTPSQLRPLRRVMQGHLGGTARGLESLPHHHPSG